MAITLSSERQRFLQWRDCILCTYLTARWSNWDSTRTSHCSRVSVTKDNRNSWPLSPAFSSLLQKVRCVMVWMRADPQDSYIWIPGLHLMAIWGGSGSAAFLEGVPQGQAQRLWIKAALSYLLLQAGAPQAAPISCCLLSLLCYHGLLPFWTVHPKPTLLSVSRMGHGALTQH